MKTLVAWDFTQRPKTLFYAILRAEFGLPEVELAQRSVCICIDQFTGRRLRALAQYYGANVLLFGIAPDSDADAEAERDAKEFILRIHRERRSRRGKRPKQSTGELSE